jgi:hypothetical protein
MSAVHTCFIHDADDNPKMASLALGSSFLLFPSEKFCEVHEDDLFSCLDVPKGPDSDVVGGTNRETAHHNV